MLNQQAVDETVGQIMAAVTKACNPLTVSEYKAVLTEVQGQLAILEDAAENDKDEEEDD